MRSCWRSNSVPIQTLEYAQNRSKIKDGDVLMYRGRSLVSRIIQLVTGSHYSHAGLAAWWNDRLMVLEAVGKGVVVTPISKNIRSYPGIIEWFTCVEDIPHDQRLELIRFAQRELGKEYALGRAILLGIRVLFQRNLESKDKLRREKRLFCSLYIAASYNAIGKDLKKEVSDRFMSPGDIAASPPLRRVGILHKPIEQAGTDVSRSSTPPQEQQDVQFACRQKNGRQSCLIYKIPRLSETAITLFRIPMTDAMKSTL